MSTVYMLTCYKKHDATVFVIVLSETVTWCNQRKYDTVYNFLLHVK
jgi:hypothetical protein